MEFAEVESDDSPHPVSQLGTFAPRRLRPGTISRDRWNQGVIGPSMRFPDPFIRRLGDDIVIHLPAYYSDRANHYGGGVEFVESGTVRLFRNGTLFGEADNPSRASFPVPPEASDYRLEVESIRAALLELSTEIDLAWTFRSAADEPSALPLTAVSFAPTLDDRNGAPAGGPFAIPLALSRQPGSAAAPLRRLTVEASYDRGQTWRRALLVRFGDVALAIIRHPGQAGTVSLRATAADRDGNTLEQTILDAYRLRERPSGEGEEARRHRPSPTPATPPSRTAPRFVPGELSGRTKMAISTRSPIGAPRRANVRWP